GTAASRHRYMEALREHFRPHLPTLSKDSQRRFETNVLRILDSKEAQDRAAVAAAPSILDFLDEADTLHFAEVKRALEAAGIEYLVDPFIVRGLDYYTRTVWEFEPASAGGQSTVGAGGRYDALMEILGGPPTPGVGFATGIERMAINLRERGLGPLAVTGPDVYIGVAGREAHGEAIRRARELRLRGQSVVLGDPSRGIGAQKRHAGQLGARDWLVIGNREISTGLTFFRDLETGTDGDTVPLGEMTLAFESMFRKVERLHEAFATARARRAGDGRPADDPLVERWLAAFRTTRNAVVHDDRLPTDDEWDTACQLLDLLRSQLERIEHTP
ncbi:MAG: ATP phosphoribosyltransferase regulatory subunit, partial [Dehalococcoidia bacterium]|nr:ATP phosphoribosyltransferase regulatory subunit [Dehalococcoidia bacterium]